MPDNLFSSLDDRRRDRLRRLGWEPAGVNTLGRPLWRAPDGSYCIEEDEAFALLDRTDCTEDE